MHIEERQMNDVTVLDLDGKFVLGADRQFGQLVDANIEAGGRKLIVNLAKVKYMDSSGLGELIAGHRAMQQANGHIKLIHLNERLIDLMVNTKLISVFEMFDSESAAIASFTPDANPLQSPGRLDDDGGDQPL
jgi:anti-sigma B factor antagonist